MKADQIKVNRHSICISYAVIGLNVDIVPVQYCGDPDDRDYLFPFDGGEPVLTSIPLHLQFIRIRKTLQKDDFAQVVRLVKWWVRKQKEKDEVFHIACFGLAWNSEFSGLHQVRWKSPKSQYFVNEWKVHTN
jgi:hypothetical protein